MNRFEKSSKLKLIISHISIPIILFISVIILFSYSLNNISKTTSSEQIKSLETALNRDIIQCYAVEGFYPPNLEYLIEHYGLTYDSDIFFIDYQSIGSNIMPDVTVLIK